METVHFENGRKFMWDGRSYESHEAAKAVQQVYEARGFDTRIHEDDGKFLVYTRRAVTQAAAEKPSTP